MVPHVVRRVVRELAARGACSAMTNAAHSKRSDYKKCKAPDVSYQVLFSCVEALMCFLVQFIWNLYAYTFTILIINKSGVQSKCTLIRRDTCIAHVKYIYDRRMIST